MPAKSTTKTATTTIIIPILSFFSVGCSSSGLNTTGSVGSGSVGSGSTGSVGSGSTGSVGSGSTGSVGSVGSVGLVGSSSHSSPDFSTNDSFPSESTTLTWQVSSGGSTGSGSGVGSGSGSTISGAFS